MECPNCGAKLQKNGKDMMLSLRCGLSGKGEKRARIYFKYDFGKRDKYMAAVYVLLGLLILFVPVKAGTSDEAKSVVIKNDYSQEVKEQGITSGFFQRFVTEAYKMSFDKVTKEQLAQIAYMHLFWEKDCDVVEYTVNDGEVQRIELPDNLARDLRDIKNFTGLKSLDVGRDDLFKGDLSGLEKLTEVRSGNTPEELLTIVEEPKKSQLWVAT